MPLQPRRCRECGARYDVMTFRGATWAVDHPYLATPPNHDGHDEKLEALIASGALECCPSCMSVEADHLIGRVSLGGDASQAIRYPYFDRGLGAWVESSTHRKRLMRERGLIEGDWDDLLEQVDRDEDADDRWAKEWEEECRVQYEADPEVRQVVDRLAAEAADSDTGVRQARVTNDELLADSAATSL